MANKEGKKEAPAERKAFKGQMEILEQAEGTVLTEMGRPVKGLALSGISAGLDLGFSVLLMTVAMTSFSGVFSGPVVDFIVANMYPIGFIFVVLGRSELFTEHTTLAILPVLQGLAPIKKLFRLWGVVYLANILGGLVFALILTYFTGSLHVLDSGALKKIADAMLKHDMLTNFLTAMLAGWMMGLLVWLVTAARSTGSQILIIWIITASIGFAHLPHCIVGNIEILTSLLSGKISFVEYLQCLIPVTIGNAVGGVLFVGIVKFSHTNDSGNEKEVDLEKIVEDDKVKDQK